MVRPKVEDKRVHVTALRWNDEEKALLDAALVVWGANEGRALGATASAPVMLRALLFQYASEKNIKPKRAKKKG